MLDIDIKEEQEAPKQWSEIFNYRENIKVLESYLNNLKDYDNIIVIGNGGSITSYDAYIGALGSKLKSYTVWTMDPEYLKDIKKKCADGNTIVVAVSKSGNTLGQIESLLYFKDFDVLVITEPNKGTLYRIAEKMRWKIIPHPDIGGRFSGGTASAFAPARIAGLNIKDIQSGIDYGYKKLKNKAYNLANFYFKKEKEGFEEIYCSLYASRLYNFQNLIIQLMHESVCKDQKGQSVYVSMGPECQHHTNQRFIGGKKNVIGTFVIASQDNSDKLNIPDNLSEIIYKDIKLSSFNGLAYADLLLAEYEGTKRDADNKGIPNVTIDINHIDEKTVGALVAFWHLVAFYSSIIRGVNPFDQPAVEDSKNITLDIIKEKI